MNSQLSKISLEVVTPSAEGLEMDKLLLKLLEPGNRVLPGTILFYSVPMSCLQE